MSSFKVMPRAYRRQLEAEDQAKIQRVTREEGVREDEGSAGRLRGIPAIGRGVSGAIRDTRPGDGLR